MIKDQVIREVESVPTEFYLEIINFINYLKFKHLSHIPETMLLSEKSLSEDWNTPEEDKAWADL